MTRDQNPNANHVNRRNFVKAAAATGLAASALGSTTLAAGYHHSVRDSIRVGLIGCGGRGKGAAINACNADPAVVITSIADAFPDSLEDCHSGLGKKLKEKYLVKPETMFFGLDCHEKLLETDVDAVILAQPPYFRPASLKACIEAGKHVFCEKPVGVDVPGVLLVQESCNLAKEKGLSIVSGLCWRYDLGVRATMERIKEGALGRIITIQENYLTGELWHKPMQPEWTPMEYQIRNWLYFSWLSGDIPLEQHIHSLDKAMWLMDDVPPARCYGTGGRQKRVDPKWGNVYDHFSTCYEWENGVRTFSYCRQQNDCFMETEDHVFGTDGRARILANEVQNSKGVWKYEGEKPNMYDVEHVELMKSIRDSKPINNGDYMVKSTLMAIMGRMANYTGKQITWEELLADKTVMGPGRVEFGDFEPDAIPIPGGKIS